MPGPSSCPSERDGAEHVGLGPLRADLAETYWRWENALPVMAGYARQTPESLTERSAGLEAQLEDSADQARFTIYRHQDDTWTPAGMTSLLIDDRYRTGEFAAARHRCGSVVL